MQPDPRNPGLAATGEDVAELYLDLLKRTLSRTNTTPTTLVEINPDHRSFRAAFRGLRPLFARRGIKLMRERVLDERSLEIGMHCHPDADTMIGMRRLDNIHRLARQAIRDGVPGDLMEAGVWRGGATIFMRGLLKAYGITDRVVWAADSFEGLPLPDLERFPVDGEVHLWEGDKWGVDLGVSLDHVRERFARYGLLDEQVRFLPGWFKDTLRDAPIERLAVLRLDGDLYESTMETLEALYEKVSAGGYVIVDDYGAWEPCHRAVEDFRASKGITEEIQWVDWTGAFWQKAFADGT